jgi:hypothetical protein
MSTLPSPQVIKGNRREIPGGLPPGLWWDKVREYRASPVLATLPWYHPCLEYLRPDELAQMRAKALVWYVVTGDFPRDINCWWEVRQARKRGEIPARTDIVLSHVRDDGALVCGDCGARWAPHHDGTPQADECKLCGVRWITEGEHGD